MFVSVAVPVLQLSVVKHEVTIVEKEPNFMVPTVQDDEHEYSVFTLKNPNSLKKKNT